MRLLISLPLLITISAVSAIAKDAETVTQEFFDAIVNGDRAIALEHFIQLPGLPMEALIDRMIEFSKKSKIHPKPVTSREETELAIVVLHGGVRPDGTIDYDAVYLIRDGKAWKMTINIRFDDDPPIPVSKLQVTEYQQLKKGYRATVKKLPKTEPSPQ